jgi:glutamyl-tRNA synthetase
MTELIEAFSVDRISKSGAKFDANKTKWFNQQYLRAKEDADLAEIFNKELLSKGINADINYVENVCALIKEKAQFITEFWSLAFYFFEEPTDFDAEVINKRWKDNVPDFLLNLTNALKTLEDFSHTSIENKFKEIAEQTGISPGSVMQIFRVAISGLAAGPAIFEMISLIGKEKVVARLERAIKHFNETK